MIFVIRAFVLTLGLKLLNIVSIDAAKISFGFVNYQLYSGYVNDEVLFKQFSAFGIDDLMLKLCCRTDCFEENKSVIDRNYNYEKMSYISNKVKCHCGYSNEELMLKEFRFTEKISVFHVYYNYENMSMVFYKLKGVYGYGNNELMFKQFVIEDSFVRSYLLRIFIINYYLNCKVKNKICFRRYISYWIYCNYYNHFRIRNSDCGTLFDKTMFGFEQGENSFSTILGNIVEFSVITLINMIDISRMIGSSSNFAGDGPKRCLFEEESYDNL